jgi:hypothetical protein
LEEGAEEQESQSNKQVEIRLNRRLSKLLSEDQAYLTQQDYLATAVHPVWLLADERQLALVGAGRGLTAPGYHHHRLYQRSTDIRWVAIGFWPLAMNGEELVLIHDVYSYVIQGC